MPRLRRQGRAVLVDRQLGMPVLLQPAAEVDPGGGVPRIERHRAGVRILGILRSRALQVDAERVPLLGREGSPESRARRASRRAVGAARSARSATRKSSSSCPDSGCQLSLAVAHHDAVALGGDAHAR